MTPTAYRAAGTAGWMGANRDRARRPARRAPAATAFDARFAENRDDVVLAHLEYPLVAQATRLLRSAIWGGRTTLNRVAALKFTPPPDAGVNGLLVAVFARLVLVGADGRRLHEEIILSGRIVPPAGQSRRVELEETGTKR